MYQATEASLKAHAVPQWFSDAKFGIFIHWGLYSVPAYAPPTEGDIRQEFAGKGLAALKESPYAEWYRNSMCFKDCRTWKHHRERYGENFAYRDFRPLFDDAAKAVDARAWAKLFKEAGARYVVMVTKHHDGFCLWPTEQANTRREHWHTDRDFVGEVADAVRAEGIKMGLYYSGVFDWTYTHEPICSAYTMIASMYHDKEYVEYCNAQIKELIDRYRPSVLWNDMGYPAHTDINELFTYYYNHVADGVVNDRWKQTDVPAPGTPERERMKRELETRDMVFGGDQPDSAAVPHSDFLTPEYAIMLEATPYKWETCRGIGKSFGYNAAETEKDILSYSELVTLFADVVSKNGNLLLNVGPRADGSIQEEHAALLRRFGRFLRANGEAFFATRPWMQPSAETEEKDVSVRFTQTDGYLYLSLLGIPRSGKVVVRGVHLPEGRELTALGGGDPIRWNNDGGDMVLRLPHISAEPVTCFRMKK